MAVGQGWNSWVSFKEMAGAYSAADGGGARSGYARVTDGVQLVVDENFYIAPGFGGRNIRAKYPGRRMVDLTLPIETNYEGGWLYLLKHFFGLYAFTPNNPVATVNTHQFYDLATLPTGLYIELSAGDTPTNQVFLLEGCKVNTFEFGLDQDSLLSASFGIIARECKPGTARIASPTYPTDKHIKSVHYNPSYAVNLANLAGSTLATVQSFKITGNNDLQRRFNLGRYTAEPVAVDPLTIEVEIVADFEDLTHYNKFLAATTGGFQIDLTGDIITGATRNLCQFIAIGSSILESAPINLQGRGPITIPFKATIIGASTPVFSMKFYNQQATL